MLKNIWMRVLTILQIASASSRRLDSVEQRLVSLEAKLQEAVAILCKIRDEVVPDPATSIKLDAGPVQEQEM